VGLLWLTSQGTYNKKPYFLGELILTQSINREEVSVLEVAIYASDGIQTTEWVRRIEVKLL